MPHTPKFVKKNIKLVKKKKKKKKSPTIFNH